MGRCFLARLCGDAINAVLAAAGSNLRKLLGLLRRDRRRFYFALGHTVERLVLTLIRRCRDMLDWTWNPIAALPDRQVLYLAAA